MEQTKKKGLLRRVWDGYSKFCQDIGVEKGEVAVVAAFPSSSLMKHGVKKKKPQ